MGTLWLYLLGNTMDRRTEVNRGKRHVSGHPVRQTLRVSRQLSANLVREQPDMPQRICLQPLYLCLIGQSEIGFPVLRNRILVGVGWPHHQEPEAFGQMRAKSAIMKFAGEAPSILFIRQVTLKRQDNGYPRVRNQEFELLRLQRKKYGAGNLRRRLDTAWNAVAIQSFEQAAAQLIGDQDPERCILVGTRMRRRLAIRLNTRQNIRRHRPPAAPFPSPGKFALAT